MNQLCPLQRNNLLLLYSTEIVDLIAVFHGDLESHFGAFLSPKELSDSTGVVKDWHRFGAMFWTKLVLSPLVSALYGAVLNFVALRDAHLHFCLSLKERNARCKGFRELLSVAGDLLPVLARAEDLHKVLEVFSSICDQYAKFVQSCERIRNNSDPLVLARKLLRSIQFLGLDAFDDLLFAIYQSIEAGRRLVHQLRPNFLSNYRYLQYQRRQKAYIVHICPTAIPVYEFLRGIDQEDQRFDFDIRCDDLSTILEAMESNGQTNTVTEMDVNNGKLLLLRDYQKELIASALRGENTIICAPTGSGKTVVAAMVIKDHLNRATADGKKRKVSFLLPNNTFLDQQKQLLDDYLGHKWRIIGLSGASASDVPKSAMIRSADVVVITPQLLLNILNPKAQNGDRLALDDFSLLVFDEAHHTHDDHPFNQIMRVYHRISYTDPGCKLPQILGLTASLGAGGSSANDVTNAVEHVLKMCANLNCTSISRVSVHRQQLAEYQTANKDEIDFVPSDYRDKAEARILNDVMQEFEKDFARRANIANDENTHNGRQSFTLPEPPGDRSRQQYEQWFSQLLMRDLPQLTAIDPEWKQAMTECLQQIKIFYRTMELHAHLPPRVAVAYLKDEQAQRVIFTPEWVKEIIQPQITALEQIMNNGHNDLLEKLIEQLIREFRKSSDSRVIVFVRTRDLTVRMEQALNERSELVNMGVKTSRLTSVNTSKDVGGQCLGEHLQQLKDFNSGAVKILCATSVAEEGLDIRACNLVIKYNYATNEIAHVQRRGRGRAEGSRCILLTHERWLKEKEEINIEREKMMAEALDAIERKPDQWRLDKIAKFKDTSLQKMQLDDALAEVKRLQQNENVYNLHCKKCDRIICTSDRMRCAENSQYLIVDPMIWSKVEYIGQPPRVFESNAIIGKSLCECGQNWGQIIKRKCVYLPTLAAESFSFERIDNTDPNRKRLSQRKWKKILEHFDVGQLTNLDLATMKNAPKRLKFDDGVPQPQLELLDLNG